MRSTDNCDRLLLAFILISSICLNSKLVSSTNQTNQNAELLKSLRERPGSVLVIHSVQTSGNKTTTSTRALRFDGEYVHRYVEEGKHFIRDTDSPQHYSKTREQIPANVSAAFTGPDKEIYFFSGDKYCKRPLVYRGEKKFCPHWEESRHLFGCHHNYTHTESLCANPTVDGVASDKKDASGRTKFIYQGHQRWILVLGVDGKHGHISLDDKYQHKKAATNQTFNVAHNLTATTNHSSPADGTHNSATVAAHSVIVNNPAVTASINADAGQTTAAPPTIQLNAGLGAAQVSSGTSQTLNPAQILPSNVTSASAQNTTLNASG